MIEISTVKKEPNYSSFVFFSAGPVGDHAMILDTANRFYESTGRPSYILSKHPNRFLSDLLLPYKDHVTEIPFKGFGGKVALATLILKSIFVRHCYVLFFAIPHPTYIKVFAFCIRFFTRSRIVGLNSLCGFKSIGGPKHSATFLGRGNYIEAHVDTNLFYEQANNLLEWLGYKKISWAPTLTFTEDSSILNTHHLVKNEYIVFHLTASSVDKSLSPDRWNAIIQKVIQNCPDKKIVFSGAAGDWAFVKESLGDIKEESIVNLCGKVGMRELLTVYQNAKVTVSVHTGNAMLINMLALQSVIVNIKGVYMFKYHYNPNSVDCTGVIACTCNPFERSCTLLPYKGKEYMACLFSNDDNHILEEILKKARLE